MPRYFVSLTGPLLGLYLDVDAPSEDHLRLAMHHSKLKELWCAIYNPEAFESYGAFTLHKVRFDRLPFDHHDYEQDLREYGVE